MKLFRQYIVFMLLFKASFLLAQSTSPDALALALQKNNNTIISASLYITEHPTLKNQFSDEWSDGSIEFKNGKKALQCKLRYNAWKDELIWLRESDYKMGMVIKPSVKAFTANNKRFILHYNLEQNNKAAIYLEELNNGKIALYCHRKVTYIKSSNVFSLQHQYYLKKDEQFSKVKITKASLFKLFTEAEQKEIKEIIKTKHLKFKDEYQLAKAFDSYNKMQMEK